MSANADEPQSHEIESLRARLSDAEERARRALDGSARPVPAQEAEPAKCPECDGTGQGDPSEGWSYYGVIEPGSIPPCDTCRGTGRASEARDVKHLGHDTSCDGNSGQGSEQG